VTSVLVTGGSGFVGGRLAQRLVSKGHEVVIFDRVQPADGTDVLGATRTVLGDIRDADAVLRACQEAHPDVVAHLAAALSDDAASDPRGALEINCKGMINVLEAARSADVPRVVWASSGSVFGAPDPASGLIPEDAPFTPRSIYAGTKIMCELIADQYAARYGLTTVGLRLALMTSAGKTRGISGRIAHELIDRPLAGEKSVVPYGDDVPSWLWIEDAVTALELAITADRVSSRVYNVGGDDRSIREAVEIVRGLLPAGAEIDVESGRAGMEHRLDNSRIEQELGFTRSWPLERQLGFMLGRPDTGDGTDATAVTT
jgi:UDP-glucose 4-epimerase